MLTRSLYLALSWFVISFIGLLLGGRRLSRPSAFLSILWLAAVILLGDAWALLTFGIPGEILLLSGGALLVGFAVLLWLPDWNAFGQVLYASSLVTTLLFIVYSFLVTAFSPLNPQSFIFAFIFFFIETFALLLALTHAYESLDATTRVVWRRRIERLQPVPGYAPKVSLHVPTYNEPPEVVQRTLQSLAKLDYPNYEVLVVDNNTPDEAVWRSLENIVREMGPPFRFLHLDRWPGYKSGALNFALSQTAPDAEIISTIDADYQLEPDFLAELVPAFSDPRVAFVQTPQDYRDVEDHPYTQATYYSYKYFFEVSMPVRNEHNAIIFAGTMGLIRKSVLQEIGGWDEWCITEDAEASLRILKRGYESIYINRSFGHGLMPFTFDGLKKQRFRWCFGGIQILRKHWEALMPWARWIDPQNRLTSSQRHFYLTGGLQWYTELLNLLFAFFLVLGALFSLLNAGTVIRPLTIPLMVLPAIFLVLNMFRFLWVLRQKLNLSWKMALITMYNFFSLGWVVTLASLQGLFQPKGVFLRTPKTKSKSKVWQSLQAARWETGIGLVCLAAGITALVERPGLKTLFLGSLLVWQSGLYLAAPVFSLLSVSPARSERPVPAPGGAVRENWAARYALALLVLLVAVAVLAQILPPPAASPSYSRFQPPEIQPQQLLGIDRVPIEQRGNTPTPAPTAQSTGAPTSTVLPGTTLLPSGTPLPLGTLVPTLSGTPLQAPTLPPVPLPSSTLLPPAPTLPPVPLPSSTPLQAPTLPAVPQPTLPPAPLPSSTPVLAPTLPPVSLPSSTPLPLPTLPHLP